MQGATSGEIRKINLSLEVVRIYHFKTQLLKDLLSSHTRYTLIRLWAPRFHMFLLDGFGNSDKIYSLYTGMPKGLPAATEPVSIVVAEGIVLKTTIDPLTKKHQVICDVCNKKVRLTKSAHPHGLFEHRKFCIIRERKQKSENQPSSSIFRVSNPVQPHVGSGSGRIPRLHSLSGIIASFSEMQTECPIPSPTINSAPFSGHFQVPIIRRPRPARNCPGSEIDWKAGSIWQTYPYHQHELRLSGLGWRPIGFNSKDNNIILRSEKCAIELFEFDESPCSNCRAIQYSVEFQNFVSRATQLPKDHTPWNFLTAEQMLALLKKMAAQLKNLRTKV